MIVRYALFALAAAGLTTNVLAQGFIKRPQIILKSVGS